MRCVSGTCATLSMCVESRSVGSNMALSAVLGLTLVFAQRITWVKKVHQRCKPCHGSGRVLFWADVQRGAWPTVLSVHGLAGWQLILLMLPLSLCVSARERTWCVERQGVCVCMGPTAGTRAHCRCSAGQQHMPPWAPGVVCMSVLCELFWPITIHRTWAMIGVPAGSCSLSMSQCASRLPMFSAWVSTPNPECRALQHRVSGAYACGCPEAAIACGAGSSLCDSQSGPETTPKLLGTCVGSADPHN